MSKTLLLMCQFGLLKSKNSAVTSNINNKEVLKSNTCLTCAVSFTENMM